MVDNVRNIIDEYTENITNIAPRTSDEYLFSDGKGNPLPKDNNAEFHTIISKGLF